jgi:hypothetical protein
MTALNHSHAYVSGLRLSARTAATNNEAKFHPDSAILSKLIAQMNEKKTLFDLHREFLAVAKPWESKAVTDYFSKGSKKKLASRTSSSSAETTQRRKKTSTTESVDGKSSITSEQQEELLNARFIYALHDLMTIGLIDVKASRPGVDATVTVIRCAYSMAEQL